MKATVPAFLGLILFLQTPGIAQKSSDRINDLPIELVKENEFVVKLLKAVDTTGKKIPKIAELDSFDAAKKIFIFKDSKAKFKKISAENIKEIAFVIVRQGVLTGKPKSLRVVSWNGKMKTFELAYRDVMIKGGTLFLNPSVVSKQFDDSDMLRTNSQEWSDKLYKYWAKVKKESPQVFASDFGYENGRGIMSRKIAAEYCEACVNLEILRIQINPANETITIRCREVFYDKWNE